MENGRQNIKENKLQEVEEIMKAYQTRITEEITKHQEKLGDPDFKVLLVLGDYGMLNTQLKWVKAGVYIEFLQADQKQSYQLGEAK